MKKIAVLVFALILTASALAEIDLTGMTYDELVALKDQINLAIWNSEEWQEVTVPQGLWIVGEDIPAGKWTVKCADVNRDEYDMHATVIEWGDAIDENDQIDYFGRHGYEWIYNPDHSVYESGEVVEVTFDFHDGDIIDINTEHAPAVFMPYSGKPSLGFK